MEKRGSEMSRTSFFATLLAVFLAASVISLSSNQSQEGQETSSFKIKLARVYHNISEDVREGSVVLLVKFLNFSIAKFVQIRFLSLTQMASYSLGSILFWVILTRSVFDLYN
ncbi:hypothetical protein QQ045_001183 [Rhodiola kirilowii]